MQIRANVAATLNVFRGQSVPSIKLICELIDNSIDANASEVEIVIKRTKGRRTVRVTDNGCGCLDADKFFSVGEHGSHETTKLGRYGYGFPAATVALGSSVKVVSTREGRRLNFTANWDRTIEHGDLQVKPRVVPHKGAPGTSVEIAVSEGKVIPGATSLAEDLGFIYANALNRGDLKITLVEGAAKTTLVPTQPQKHSDAVCVPFVAGGLSATLVAVMVPAGTPNPRPGCHLVCGGRTIDSLTRIGPHTTEGFFAWIVADDPRLWPLSANKDALLDTKGGAAIKADVEAAVLKHCGPLLKAASEQAMLVKLDGIAARANEMLRRDDKEKRQSPSKPGARTSEKEGSLRLNAKESQPGGDRIKSRGGTLAVSWSALGPSRFAETNVHSATVMFNSEGRWADQVKDLKQEAAAMVMSSAARLLYLAHLPGGLSEDEVLRKVMNGE